MKPKGVLLVALALVIAGCASDLTRSPPSRQRLPGGNYRPHEPLLVEGLIINTGEVRLEIHIYPGHQCLYGQGCLARAEGVGLLVVERQPLGKFFLGSSSLLAFSMGATLQKQKVALPPGPHTAFFCPNYSNEFGCKGKGAPDVRHFTVDPSRVDWYQPYPHAPYNHRLLVPTPWKIEVGLPKTFLTLQDVFRVRVDIDFRALNPFR